MFYVFGNKTVPVYKKETYLILEAHTHKHNVFTIRSSLGLGSIVVGLSIGGLHRVRPLLDWVRGCGLLRVVGWASIYTHNKSSVIDQQQLKQSDIMDKENNASEAPYLRSHKLFIAI